MQWFGCSQRDALRLAKMSATTCLHKPVKKDGSALKMRSKDITRPRLPCEYRRVHVLLRREGHKDNVKRVYRLSREEGLPLRLRRPRRNKAGRLRRPKQVAHTINEICGQRGLPKTIKTDNGSEFISKVMDKRACERGVELDFSRPGNPEDNAGVESFNGRLRQACLNASCFLSLADARTRIRSRRTYYAKIRPHSALQWATPAELARRCCLQAATAMSKDPEISTFERYCIGSRVTPESRRSAPRTTR